MKTIDIPKKLPYWQYFEHKHGTPYWEYMLEEDMDRNRLVVFKAVNENKRRLWFLTDYVVPIKRGPSRFFGNILSRKQAADPNCRPDGLATVAVRQAQASNLPTFCFTTEHYPSDPVLSAREDIVPFEKFIASINEEYLVATERWLYGRI